LPHCAPGTRGWNSPRIARALVHGGHLNPRQAHQLFQADRDRLVDVTADSEPESIDVDRGRDVRPVPAHEELVIGGEHVAVKDIHRCFQQGRMDALEDHASLAGKCARHRALRIAAGEMQVGQPLRDALRQRRRSGDGCTAERGILQETAAACFGRELGIQSVHGRILSGKMVAGAAVRSKRSERRY
jgi:hypothetical protein